MYELRGWKVLKILAKSRNELVFEAKLLNQWELFRKIRGLYKEHSASRLMEDKGCNGTMESGSSSIADGSMKAWSGTRIFSDAAFSDTKSGAEVIVVGSGGSTQRIHTRISLVLQWFRDRVSGCRACSCSCGCGFSKQFSDGD